MRKRPDLTNWNPYENHSCDDCDAQDMKASYENKSTEEQLEFKKELYDGMVQDGTIEDGDMP